jgi:hypothetical protein
VTEHGISPALLQKDSAASNGVMELTAAVVAGGFRIAGVLKDGPELFLGLPGGLPFFQGSLEQRGSEGLVFVRKANGTLMRGSHGKKYRPQYQTLKIR